MKFMVRCSSTSLMPVSSFTFFCSATAPAAEKRITRRIVFRIVTPYRDIVENVAGEDVELRIPFVTLIKIAAAVLLAAIIIKLWPIILMIVIAALIAVMLDPIVVWLEAHGVHRWLSVTAVAF